MKSLSKHLNWAGVDKSAEHTTGFVAILAALFSLLGLALSFVTGFEYSGLISKLISDWSPFLKDFSDPLGLALWILVVTFSCIAFISIVAWVYILLMVDARRKQVEAVLPDFLQLAAANVRAGMPVDQALWYAARPEFGIFSEEVELAAKRTFGGEPFSSALEKLSERFNSKYVRRSISLINQGLSSGGEMGEILERTGSDIRNMEILFKEINASLLMYIIFIVVSTLLGAPFLYAVSYKLISVLERIWQQIPVASTMQVPGQLVTPSAPTITSGDFLLFAVTASILTSIFASLIISVVQTGSKKNGAKTIPVFVFVSLSLFVLLTILLNAWFAGILQ